MFDFEKKVVHKALYYEKRNKKFVFVAIWGLFIFYFFPVESYRL